MKIATCAIAACLSWACTSHAAPLWIDTLSSTVTPAASGELVASFTLTFDRAPELFGLDGLQVYLDSEAPNPIDRINAAYDGTDADNQTQTVLSFRDIAETGMLTVIWARASSSPLPRHPSGWGSVEGAIPFELAGNVLTFSAPVALLRDTDSRFFYTVDVLYDRRATYQFNGVSGWTHVYEVPEPGSVPLVLAGLAGVFAIRTHRSKLQCRQSPQG